jgi:hypothetical protein
MKVLKTKKEKTVEAKETSSKNLADITAKVEDSGKVEIEFERNDFKEEISVPGGFGFQDMKKENRILITELVKLYDVKFYPKTFPCGGFGLTVIVKKSKE